MKFYQSTFAFAGVIRSLLRNMLSYFGFLKPYNFNRAIVTIIVCFAASVLILLTIYWNIGSNLPINSPRMFFIGYIGLLLTSVLFTLKWKIASYLLLLWACIELTLIFSTYVLYKIGIAVTPLVPSIESYVGRFEYHPLLMAVPKKNWVSQSGLNIEHNSVGLRGAEIKDLSDKALIHAYGGSTTYDVGVPNGSTWTEFLELTLVDKAVVANFGVPGYSSAEHIIQTAFYSDKLGRYPVCSIYYIGWNDIRNSHIPTLDKGYADFHLLSQFSNLSLRPSTSIGVSPFYALLRNFLSTFDWIPVAPDFRSQQPSDIQIDSNLEKIYISNINAIVALNQSRGIKTIFVGQVLNRGKLLDNSVYGWLPLVRDHDVWPIQVHFNNLLSREALKLGVASVSLDIEVFKDEDFVDKGHFSMIGSKKFANLLSPTIRTECN